MQLKRVAIFGVGLLGGSIGLALRARGGYRVVGYGHRISTLEQAREIGAIDEIAQDAKAAADGADLIILCTPVGLFEKLLTEIAPTLKPDAIVTDVEQQSKRSASSARPKTNLQPAEAHFIGRPSHWPAKKKPAASSSPEHRLQYFAGGSLHHHAHAQYQPSRAGSD